MTTNANAPVETRHLDEANLLLARPPYYAHLAQALANLEAANNRLAEIDRIAKKDGWARMTLTNLAPERKVAALASGHTPSPCPGCAAKDEAMAERAREVSEAIKAWFGSSRIPDKLSRFINPPADEVAETLKAVLFAYGVTPVITKDPYFDAALAELKKRLPLGGAK